MQNAIMVLICADMHANEEQNYENEYLELSVVIVDVRHCMNVQGLYVKHKAIILRFMPIIINDAIIMAFIRLVNRAIFWNFCV